MPYSGLVRDPDAIKKLVTVTADGAWVAKANCKIVVPSRFLERILGSLEPEVYTVAIFALVTEDGKYAVSCAPSLMRLTPTDLNTVVYEDMEYQEFIFDKGAVICPELNLVVRNELVYYIYSEIMAKGNVPWYIDYVGLGNLFKGSKHFAGVTVGANHAVWEMMVSSLARVPDDKMKYYRHNVKTEKDLLTEPVIVPLRSVIYGPTSTVARLIGAYFKEGITASLVNPSEKIEPIEDLLRR